MNDGTLVAQPLRAVASFNWIFFVELVVAGILVVFFLFYFNRLFATLVSFGIRAYTWHYHHAYVDIQSLQISPLGGRIFFKGFRYYAENETILIQSGYFTWQYWLRFVQKSAFSTAKQGRKNSEDVPADCERGAELETRENKTLPCRLEITLHGAEWFIYNRSAAYDSILDGLGYAPEKDGLSAETEDGQTTQTPSSKEFELRKRHTEQSQPDCEQTTSTETPPSETTEPDTSGEELPLTKWLKFLPIDISCHKGSIVMGNENTETLLSVSYDNATGDIDASNAGPHDYCKMVIDLDFAHPLVQIRPNPDFKYSQMTVAEQIKKHKGVWPIIEKQNLCIRSFNRLRKMYHGIRDVMPYFQRSVESLHPAEESRSDHGTQDNIHQRGNWLGLARYREDFTQDDHEIWSSIEYGRSSTIVDCPSLGIKYYWDIAGKVPSWDYLNDQSSINRPPSNINWSDAPEWGVRINLRGGTISYGPWADRQRVNLQEVFFPMFYRDVQPAVSLPPNSLRQCTHLKIEVEIDKEVVIRLPTREPSKDWLWKNEAHAFRERSAQALPKRHPRDGEKDADKEGHGPEIRPFGWLSLYIKGDSTINYMLNLTPSTSGFENRLNLDLSESRLMSSINHALLWESRRQTISCDLSTPLKWNAQRSWTFNIDSSDLNLFVLRDHIFLMVDLLDDWSSGMSSDFYTFVPSKYTFNLAFKNFRTYLNVNDRNVINIPTSLDENAFLSIHGERVTARIDLDQSKYRPSKSTIPVEVKYTNASLDLSTPNWDTHSSYLRDNSIANVKNMSFKGSHTYHTETSPELIDVLNLDVFLSSPKLHLSGLLVHYMLLLRANYFGDDIHFKTIDEFKEDLKNTGQKRPSINPSQKSNDIDIIIGAHTKEPCFLFPVNIYDRQEYLRFDCPSLDIDFRFTNYYMDLHVNLGPARFAIETFDSKASSTVSNTQLFIDGLSVHGHRMFGLPPEEPPYICNWDFDLGRISGEASPKFLGSAASAMKYLAFTMDDEENALPILNPEIIHDVTLLRVRVQSVKVWVMLDESAMLFSSQTITLKFNDLAGLIFSSKLNLNVPGLVFAIVDRRSMLQLRRASTQKPLTYAFFETDITLKTGKREAFFNESRHAQQRHIQINDRRTNRANCFSLDSDLGLYDEPQDWNLGNQPPSMPAPVMPEPLGVGHDDQFGQSSIGFFNNTTQQSFSGESFKTAFPSKMEFDASEMRTCCSTLSRDASPHAAPFASEDQLSAENEERSGPWAAPRFFYQDVEPDVKDVPPIAPVFENSSATDDSLDVDSLFDTESDENGQIFVMCEMKSGVRGFCCPDSLISMAGLLEKIQPSTPVAIIDSIQSSVINDILSQKNSRTEPPVSAIYSLRFPVSHIRMINSSSPFGEQTHGTLRDQYDLETHRVRAAVRHLPAFQGRQSDMSLHISLHSGLLSTKSETVDVMEQRGIFHLKVDNSHFSMTSMPVNTYRLQVQGLETASSSKTIVFIAALAQRTTKMADSVILPFQTMMNRQAIRSRQLIYFLSRYGTSTPDQSFLTRPSPILRAAGNFLRSNDSWKIISRLRVAYTALSAEAKSSLLQSIGELRPCPENARDVSCVNMSQWSGLTASHIKKTPIMQAVWGSPRDEALEVLDVQTFSFQIKQLRICLDPGPKENALIFADLCASIGLDIDSNGNPTPPDPQLQSVVVQTYCSKVELKVRWEISELLETVLRDLTAFVPQSSQPIPKKPAESGRDLKFQIIFMMDEATILLDCINLNVLLTGNGYKGSVMQYVPASGKSEELSVMIDGDSASIELKNNVKPLMSWNLTWPMFFVNHDWIEIDDHCEHSWKCAAASEKLYFEMQEDSLGLIGVINRLIDDEIKWILDLVAAIDTGSKHGNSRPPSTQASTANVHQLHVTTFLADYQIHVSVFPSLAYVLSGQVARLSVAPGPNSSLELDFDVKNNSHTFHSLKDHRQDIISAINIPPINGRVFVHSGPDRTFLDVDTTIELIKVDAGSVRNLMSIVNRPEITHLFSDLVRDATAVRRKVESILPSSAFSPQIKPHDDSGEITYKVHLTMAGIDMHLVAPGLNTEQHLADMKLSFGMIQAHAQNISSAGQVLRHPEFHLQLFKLALDLSKSTKSKMESCASFSFSGQALGTSRHNRAGSLVRAYQVSSRGLNISMIPQASSLVVDIAAHLQERLKSLDLSEEIKPLKRLRFLSISDSNQSPEEESSTTGNQFTKKFFDSIYSVNFHNIQVSWKISADPFFHQNGLPEDLVFSVSKVSLTTKEEDAARLRINDVQLQMVPLDEDFSHRSSNSMLLPEVVFDAVYQSSENGFRLAFNAAGKALDVRVSSGSIMPASKLQNSIACAVARLRGAKDFWNVGNTQSVIRPDAPPTSRTGKKLVALLFDARIEGAVFHLQGQQDLPTSPWKREKRNKVQSGGKYAQYVHHDSDSSATLKVPGVSFKIQYEEPSVDSPTLHAEIQIDASSNTLTPAVVPLIEQMSQSIQDAVHDPSSKPSEDLPPTRRSSTARFHSKVISEGDPASILGRCKLNIGVRIRHQEFTLSCQPIARVSATARFESSYILINTVFPEGQNRFYAITLAFDDLAVSVKHVYSNSPTANFNVASIIMSLMNSKHVSLDSGISAILKVSPVRVGINIKQVQDFLLFQEIWFPPKNAEATAASPNPPPKPDSGSQQQSQEEKSVTVQKYQEVASQGAFPWNSIITIECVNVDLDLGQTVGKAIIIARNLWLSSKKASDSEHNLCLKLSAIEVVNKGRLYGNLNMEGFKIHTSIRWPDLSITKQNPLVQAAVSFDNVRGHVFIDYQPCLAVDVSAFSFLMYNVRQPGELRTDRLVSTLEGDKFQVFGTSLTASRALLIYQTFQRLIEEKKSAYEDSVREIEKFIRRKTVGSPTLSQFNDNAQASGEHDIRMPISLHTDVTVNLRFVDIGIFPNTFEDSQVFKAEAHNFEAQFSVSPTDGKIHSALHLVLGQLSIALATNSASQPPKNSGDALRVEDVAHHVANSRGGTILKVPRVVASMETWQAFSGNNIEYIFRSSFQGKVDVGWNYSRISTIRHMWDMHSRGLASRLGKPLPQGAVQITSGQQSGEQKEKITAVVNVPLSRYTYQPLSPPFIETPQLREMGEATPPLEWIGLNRDKLPNLTHQVVIVTLTGIATDVEDAYSKILGFSS